MTYGQIARGVADGMAYLLSGVTDEPGTGIDLPGQRSFSWQTEQDDEDWEGDDEVMATALDPKTGTGSMAVGRSSPTGTAIILGSTAVVSGTTPSEITTLDEEADTGERYLMLKAQATSRDLSGSAYRITILKAIVKSPAETLANRAYNEPSSDFRYIANADGLLTRREWFETGVAIPSDLTP